MPIAALPPTTVRAIGSASIISDPYSLTKELIDNALDASAASVTVEVSQDTVEVIQVKDNGHGIPADDYPLVCKRTFTSKLRTVEDLRTVGGNSLGFRGEALASAAEISGALAVTTRVGTEPVGSVLKYGRDGELISTANISHSSGTTVRISNLFQQIPVRRQTSVKNAKKTISRIRKMIQSYAMARPAVRFTFKILKAKSESSNWMYAPGKKATLMDAALKVAGTEVASNCELKQWPSSSSQEESPTDNSGFRLVALLPRLGSDFTKFNNLGQFISIDGRPISSGRGIAQAIVKTYKSHLRSVSSRDGLSPPITDPFLCMQIICPEGVYDVNIEPSKDDVLFEDQQMVLALTEDFFRDVYGDQDVPSNGSTAQDRDSSHNNGFESLLSGHETPVQASPFQERGFMNARSVARPDQSIGLSLPEVKSSFGKRPGHSPFVQSNNTRRSSILPPENVQPGFPIRNGQLESSRLHTSPHQTRQTGSLDTCLPSPASSLDAPPESNVISPLWSRTSPGGLTQLSPTTSTQSTRKQLRDRDRERYGNGSLDTWFLKLSQASQTPEVVEDPPAQTDGPPLSQLTQDRFGSMRSRSNAAPRDASPESVMLLDRSQTPPGTTGHTSRTSNKPQGLPVLEQWSARLYNASNPDENPELQKALEFEARKKAAIQERRMQFQGSSTNSPHQSRYLAARAALSSQPDQSTPQPVFETAAKISEAAKPVLRPHDPRAYLMHLQNSDCPSNSKLKRITSSKLPFEKTPDGHDLHAVGLTLPAELASIRESFDKIREMDVYTQSGDQLETLTSPNISSAAAIWHDRLTTLINAQYRSLGNDSDLPDLQFDFSGLAAVSTGT
ncbi:hypothetical protein BDV18DRAFT_166540 [Aspergillus unguis]